MIVVGLLATSALSFLCGFLFCGAISKNSGWFCGLAMLCVPFAVAICAKITLVVEEDVRRLRSLEQKCIQAGIAEMRAFPTEARFEFIEASAPAEKPEP